MPCNNQIWCLKISFSTLTPLLLLVACSSTPQVPIRTTVPVSSASNVPALPPAGSGRGGYYKDDGPGDVIPQGLLNIPNAIPTVEPYSRTGNRPYVVFGKTYTPLTDDQPFKQRGIGSWYGKKFHLQKTSSGELYDMYKMTAAHPTLPIPSYARVTNLKTRAQVIVRVNDRGPFHSNRIIDLSYTAALKLGYLGHGSSELEVERLLPADIIAMNTLEKPPLPTGYVTQPDQNNSGSIPTIDTTNVVTGSFYLQFGAYSQQSNAEAAREKLMQQLSGLVNKMENVIVNGLYRLYSGPYASRSAADSILEQVRQRSTETAIIVQR